MKHLSKKFKNKKRIGVSFRFVDPFKLMNPDGEEEMNRMERSLTKETKRHDEFAELIAEHDDVLGRYCRFLTGSVADGQDLLQETWLKAWAAFREHGGARNRTYLRSIAYHAWIDRMRKGRDEAISDPINEEGAACAKTDPLRLWPAAERLVRVLTPDQRTVYLLMEYLRFTAAETAELLGTTEGGVKASLHRARKKLDKRRQSEQEWTEPLAETKNSDEQAVFAYMQAIQLQDVRALMVLWNGGSGEEASLAVRCSIPARVNRARMETMQLRRKPTVRRLQLVA